MTRDNKLKLKDQPLFQMGIILIILMFFPFVLSFLYNFINIGELLLNEAEDVGWTFLFLYILPFLFPLLLLLPLSLRQKYREALVDLIHEAMDSLVLFVVAIVIFAPVLLFMVMFAYPLFYLITDLINHFTLYEFGYGIVTSLLSGFIGVYFVVISVYKTYLLDKFNRMMTNKARR